MTSADREELPYRNQQPQCPYPPEQEALRNHLVIHTRERSWFIEAIFADEVRSK